MDSGFEVPQPRMPRRHQIVMDDEDAVDEMGGELASLLDAMEARFYGSPASTSSTGSFSAAATPGLIEESRAVHSYAVALDSSVEDDIDGAGVMPLDSTWHSELMVTTDEDLHHRHQSAQEQHQSTQALLAAMHSLRADIFSFHTDANEKAAIDRGQINQSTASKLEEILSVQGNSLAILMLLKQTIEQRLFSSAAAAASAGSSALLAVPSSSFFTSLPLPAITPRRQSSSLQEPQTPLSPFSPNNMAFTPLPPIPSAGTVKVTPFTQAFNLLNNVAQPPINNMPQQQHSSRQAMASPKVCNTTSASCTKAASVQPPSATTAKPFGVGVFPSATVADNSRMPAIPASKREEGEESGEEEGEDGGDDEKKKLRMKVANLQGRLDAFAQMKLGFVDMLKTLHRDLGARKKKHEEEIQSKNADICELKTSLAKYAHNLSEMTSLLADKEVAVQALTAENVQLHARLAHFLHGSAEPAQLQSSHQAGHALEQPGHPSSLHLEQAHEQHQQHQQPHQHQQQQQRVLLPTTTTSSTTGPTTTSSSLPPGGMLPQLPGTPRRLWSIPQSPLPPTPAHSRAGSQRTSWVRGSQQPPVVGGGGENEGEEEREDKKEETAAEVLLLDALERNEGEQVESETARGTTRKQLQKKSMAVTGGGEYPHPSSPSSNKKRVMTGGGGVGELTPLPNMGRPEEQAMTFTSVMNSVTSSNSSIGGGELVATTTTSSSSSSGSTCSSNSNISLGSLLEGPYSATPAKHPFSLAQTLPVSGSSPLFFSAAGDEDENGARAVSPISLFLNGTGINWQTPSSSHILHTNAKNRREANPLAVTYNTNQDHSGNADRGVDGVSGFVFCKRTLSPSVVQYLVSTNECVLPFWVPPSCLERYQKETLPCLDLTATPFAWGEYQPLETSYCMNIPLPMAWRYFAGENHPHHLGGEEGEGRGRSDPHASLLSPVLSSSVASHLLKPVHLLSSTTGKSSKDGEVEVILNHLSRFRCCSCGVVGSSYPAIAEKEGGQQQQQKKEGVDGLEDEHITVNRAAEGQLVGPFRLKSTLEVYVHDRCAAMATDIRKTAGLIHKGGIVRALNKAQRKHCFHCSQRGPLLRCADCPRSFHPYCALQARCYVEAKWQRIYCSSHAVMANKPRGPALTTTTTVQSMRASGTAPSSATFATPRAISPAVGPDPVRRGRSPARARQSPLLPSRRAGGHVTRHVAEHVEDKCLYERAAELLQFVVSNAELAGVLSPVCLPVDAPSAHSSSSSSATTTTSSHGDRVMTHLFLSGAPSPTTVPFSSPSFSSSQQVGVGGGNGLPVALPVLPTMMKATGAVLQEGGGTVGLSPHNSSSSSHKKTTSLLSHLRSIATPLSPVSSDDNRSNANSVDDELRQLDAAALAFGEKTAVMKKKKTKRKHCRSPTKRLKKVTADLVLADNDLTSNNHSNYSSNSIKKKNVTPGTAVKSLKKKTATTTSKIEITSTVQKRTPLAVLTAAKAKVRMLSADKFRQDYAVFNNLRGGGNISKSVERMVAVVKGEEENNDNSNSNNSVGGERNLSLVTARKKRLLWSTDNAATKATAPASKAKPDMVF